MDRRTFITACAATALAKPAPLQSRRPNIVFFMYDDLGYANLGCYGQTKIATPHSDALAKEGTRYTDCYAGGAVCAPSRSVLMSGLHGGHAPVRANAQTVPLLDEDWTVAEIMKSAGYATGFFGKWGLGDAGTTGAPTRQGFDEFFGYLHQTQAHNYWPHYLRDGEKKFELPENLGGKMGRYSADLIAERAAGFIDKNRERPFFLLASPTSPHALYHPPDNKPYSAKPWTQFQKNYASMVTRADAELGMLLARLDKYGLRDDTVVFVTSDNGGPKLPEDGGKFFETNGPLRDYKGSVYEGGLRVPMIVRWPGKAKAGAVDSTPVYFADMMPTFAEIGGAKAPGGIDGVSMWSSAIRRDRFMYWEQNGWDSRTREIPPERRMTAVRFGDWKALRNTPAAALEIYNLKRDPSEKSDVAAANPKVVAMFEEYLRTARTQPRSHANGNPEWVGRKDLPTGSSH